MEVRGRTERDLISARSEQRIGGLPRESTFRCVTRVSSAAKASSPRVEWGPAEGEAAAVDGPDLGGGKDRRKLMSGSISRCCSTPSLATCFDETSLWGLSFPEVCPAVVRYDICKGRADTYTRRYAKSSCKLHRDAETD